MKDGYLENVEEFMSYILDVNSSTKKSIMGCSLLPGQNSSFSNQEMIHPPQNYIDLQYSDQRNIGVYWRVVPYLKL